MAIKGTLQLGGSVVTNAYVRLLQVSGNAQSMQARFSVHAGAPIKRDPDDIRKKVEKRQISLGSPEAQPRTDQPVITEIVVPFVHQKGTDIFEEAYAEFRAASSEKLTDTEDV